MQLVFVVLERLPQRCRLFQRTSDAPSIAIIVKTTSTKKGGVFIESSTRPGLIHAGYYMQIQGHSKFKISVAGTCC